MVRMAIINKLTSDKCWQGCEVTGIIVHCWWESRLGQSLLKNSIEFSQNKNRTAFWPSDFTSGDLSEENQNTNLKEHMHPYVHCSIIYINQAMEAT